MRKAKHSIRDDEAMAELLFAVAAGDHVIRQVVDKIARHNKKAQQLQKVVDALEELIRRELQRIRETPGILQTPISRWIVLMAAFTAESVDKDAVAGRLLSMNAGLLKAPSVSEVMNREFLSSDD